MRLWFNFIRQLHLSDHFGPKCGIFSLIYSPWHILLGIYISNHDGNGIEIVEIFIYIHGQGEYIKDTLTMCFTMIYGRALEQCYIACHDVVSTIYNITLAVSCPNSPAHKVEDLNFRVCQFRHCKQCSKIKAPQRWWLQLTKSNAFSDEGVCRHQCIWVVPSIDVDHRVDQ